MILSQIALTVHVGDVYSLTLGTKTLIVLSSDEAVKELLDRRSGIYSDRQEMYIGQELCSGNMRMLMMVYERSNCNVSRHADTRTALRPSVANGMEISSIVCLHMLL